MAAASPERLRDDLTRLVHRGAGLHDFSLEAARILARAVPFDGVCVLAMDPATILPVDEVVENGLPPAAFARMAQIEIGGEDFNAFAALARSEPARGEPQRGDGRGARAQPAPPRGQAPSTGSATSCAPCSSAMRRRGAA